MPEGLALPESVAQVPPIRLEPAPAVAVVRPPEIGTPIKPESVASPAPFPENPSSPYPQPSSESLPSSPPSNETPPRPEPSFSPPAESLPPSPPLPEITSSQNYYDRLGLTSDATPEQIRQAFRDLVQQFHPDKNPEGEEATKLLTAAYTELSRPDHRAVYDAGLRASEAFTASDLRTAETAATAIINIVGVNQIESAVQQQLISQGKNPQELSPVEIAGLLPETIQPIAAQLADVSAEIRLLDIPSDQRQVIDALSTAMNNSESFRNDREKMSRLGAILEILIALMIALQILQKAIAGQPWQEDFDELIQTSQEATEFISLLKHLRANTQETPAVSPSQPETPATASVPETPASSVSSPETQASDVNLPPLPETTSSSESAPAFNPPPEPPRLPETPSSVPELPPPPEIPLAERVPLAAFVATATRPQPIPVPLPPTPTPA
jgi:hypothetical protein